MLSLSRDELLALAPSHLRSFRAERYAGGGVDVPVDLFTPHDARRLHRTYAFLLALLDQIRRSTDVRALLQATAASAEWSEVFATFRDFGKETVARATSVNAGRVVHDLRGGAFQSIAAILEFAGAGQDNDDDRRQLPFLIRDHLKMMRNAVPDLDPERTAADLGSRVHDVALLVEKWTKALYRLEASAAAIDVSCEYRGGIAERCLEFSALDRVVYNLLNNAVRHAADERVQLALVATDPRETDLRIVVGNAVSPAQAQTLTARWGTDRVGELFRGGFTTGGSGLGMSICAEFVVNAYGLDSVDAALEGGYLGAALLDSRFVAWVHWPTTGV